jgi:ANTAR domain
MLLKQEKHDREQWLNGRLGEILAGRIVIEQVKGMLMLIYRLDDRQAFELLRVRSQNTNTKVRAFAEKLATTSSDSTTATHSCRDHTSTTCSSQHTNAPHAGKPGARSDGPERSD